MYKSPIDIFTHINTSIEDDIYKAVAEVGVNVDKEELIKALQYDRQQYDKGYKDGVREFAEKLKQFNIHHYCDYEWEIMNDDIDKISKELGVNLDERGN